MVIESDMPKDWPAGTLIHGDAGTLRFGQDGVELLNAEGAGWRGVELDPGADQHQELLAWIEGGPESRQAARTARSTMEIMMAIYESARTRGLVRLPLTPGPSPLLQMIEDGTLPVQVPGRYDIRA
jgi:hypothetical protein